MSLEEVQRLYPAAKPVFTRAGDTDSYISLLQLTNSVLENQQYDIIQFVFLDKAKSSGLEMVTLSWKTTKTHSVESTYKMLKAQYGSGISSKLPAGMVGYEWKLQGTHIFLSTDNARMFAGIQYSRVKNDCQ